MRNSLELGLRRNLRIREEVIGSHPQSCRIAYLSDIHLRRGRSGTLSEQVVEAVRNAGVDLILLGGDLVDQASELGALGDLSRRLVGMAPVFAIPGNHDIWVGEAAVREAVETAGVRWIQGKTERFHHGERTFVICGPGAACPPAGDFVILCAHNPKIWKKARNQGFDLVLAGHLHGCQAVCFEFRGLLFPGGFFYFYNYIKKRCGRSTLLVSLGCSDLIPIRWRCPREILVCVV